MEYLLVILYYVCIMDGGVGKGYIGRWSGGGGIGYAWVLGSGGLAGEGMGYAQQNTVRIMILMSI